MYNNHFFTKLEEIINLISSGKIDGDNGALAKFKDYLNLIKDIGPFNSLTWKKEFRKQVYKFGTLFKEQRPIPFIEAINEFTKANGDLEIIEFIKSEISYNFLTPVECKKQIVDLISKFPYNPEFRNNLGNFYIDEGLFVDAVAEYNLALKIEPKNEIFYNHRFGGHWQNLKKYIADGKYVEGKEYLKVIFESKVYNGNLLHNSLIDIDARFDDHIIFQKKMSLLEEQFKEKINTALDSERKRIIEILGFFSAIIAFVLSTVSIAKNFSFTEAIYFIFGLAICLILFALTMSLLFTASNKSILKNYKFWLLSVSLILILLFIVNISNIVCIIC
jgi:tetratricopeptide (TPR) repeat protein